MKHRSTQSLREAVRRRIETKAAPREKKPRKSPVTTCSKCGRRIYAKDGSCGRLDPKTFNLDYYHRECWTA